MIEVAKLGLVCHFYNVAISVEYVQSNSAENSVAHSLARANAKNYNAKGTPMAWILTITKNLSLMKLREKKRYQDLEPQEWDMSFHVDSETGTIEDRHLLEAALNLLNEEERQIILLHAVSGLKHREIAELLDMALATVLSKYHRGLKKLRKYLEGVDAND